MKVVSLFISFIFHPIFIVLYAYLIYFNTDTYTNRILYLFSPTSCELMSKIKSVEKFELLTLIVFDLIKFLNESSSFKSYNLT